MEPVKVSIDGPSDVHDRILGVPGTFERVSRGVRVLIAAAASQYVESKFSAEVMVSGFDAVYRKQLNEACLESRHWRRETKST